MREALSLARPNSRAEYVRILAIVVTEFELVYIERKIFAAHAMERSNYSTLNDGPEALDGVGMYRAVNVFVSPMMNYAVQEVASKPAVSTPLVGRDQANFRRNCFAHKSVEHRGGSVLDHASNDIPFPFNCPDDRSFSLDSSTAHVATSTGTFVLVLGLAADKRFVHFNVPDKLLKFDVAKCNTNLIAHEERGIVGTEPHHAIDLQGADALLAGEHHVHDAEPVAQRLVRVLKDCADQYREAVANAIGRACVAIPMLRLACMFVYVIITASRAADAIRPAIDLQVRTAGRFIRKLALELSDGHLMNLKVIFGRGHCGSYL